MGAELRRAAFFGAHLRDCDFTAAHLEGAYFQGGGSYEDADMENVDLSRAFGNDETQLPHSMQRPAWVAERHDPPVVPLRTELELDANTINGYIKRKVGALLGRFAKYLSKY